MKYKLGSQGFGAHGILASKAAYTIAGSILPDYSEECCYAHACAKKVFDLYNKFQFSSY